MGEYERLDGHGTGDMELGFGEQNGSPEAVANPVSRLLFNWMNPLMKLGYKRPLEQDDLWGLPPEDKASYVADKLASNLDEAQPNIKRAIYDSFGRFYIVAGLLKFIHDALMFAQPVFLGLMITWVTDQGSYGKGFQLVFGMVVCMAFQTLFINQYFLRTFRMGMYVRTAIAGAVYRKSLRLSPWAKAKSTTGQIVNLMSNDANRLQMLFQNLHLVWSAPMQIIIGLALLFNLLGWSAAAGLVVMIVLIPLQGWFSKNMIGISKSIIEVTDKRVAIINEVLAGIKVIKFYAWERQFTDKVLDLRQQEIDQIMRMAYWRAGNLLVILSSPVLVSVFTFVAYAGSGHELSAEVVFTALALFNILRFPMSFMPRVISVLIDAKVTIKRLEEFLAGDELAPVSKLVADDRYAITIQDGSFSWSDEQVSPTLTDINLEVEKGKLVIVVGEVGSGKSTLLSSILGELKANVGSDVRVAGSVAYVAQEAWVLNDTLRGNILFGHSFNQAKYDATVAACALGPDIDVLPGGDATEIGERGINLSGGQKQRVSMGRAVYNDAEVYLLDDPLSAVDSHVGRHIFDECIAGALKDKTRVLVTHQLRFLPAADWVVVMKDGRIQHQGSYAELVKSGVNFAAFDEEMGGGAAAAADGETDAAEGEGDKAAGDKATGDKAVDDADKPRTAEEQAKLAAKNKIIEDEARETGAVKFRNFKGYYAAFGGFFPVATFVLFMLAGQATRTGSDLWLAVWTDSDDALSRVGFYLGVLVALGLGNSLINYGRGIVLGIAGCHAGRVLHENLFLNIIRAPMSFYDTVPLGRILNRFSKDLSGIDNDLPMTLSMFAAVLIVIFATMVVISAALPWFILPVLPMMGVYFMVQQYYRRTSRELKRLDSVSRSPIYAHFSESLVGMDTIRAYGQVTQFYTDNEMKMDANNRAYWMTITANRWLSVRLETVGIAIVFFCAGLIVLSRDSVDPGIAGLALGYALQVTGSLTWMVRMATETENQMNAVERILEYTEIPVEAPAEIENEEKPSVWPSEGKIEFKDVVFAYRPGLPAVLHNVSFSVNGNEKIGIVGRTGAGKSTVTQALFRLVELQEGSVLIDGVDIASLGLDTLRKALSIIPQDPVLFSGTVRDNLDPFAEYDEHELWSALERCHLRSAIEALDDGLDHVVAENGSNFSVGERQLLCMGRALLKKSTILVMDEATAAVDMETDRFIQEAVRTAFADRTVLCIAHRLNTIMDSDRILVMDDGRVAEFDSPAKLLENPNGTLTSMVADTGPKWAAHLHKIARGEVTVFDAPVGAEGDAAVPASLEGSGTLDGGAGVAGGD